MKTHARNDSVLGLIPAGGRSSRFGTSKATHVLDGLTLIERVHAALRAEIDDVRLGLARPEDPPPLDGPARVFDDPPGAGPAGSLRGAFLASNAEWVLVAACDMPGITAEAVRTLLGARSGAADAVVAVDPSGGLHPLFACYRRSCLSALDRYLSAERRSMRGLVASLDHVAVPFDEKILWNVNRPADLEGPPGAA